MSTTGPLAPITVAEESCGSSTSQFSNPTSPRTSPTENLTVKDDCRKSPPENLPTAVTEGKNIASSSEWKCNLSWEECLDGGGDGLTSWDDDECLNFESSTPPVQRWGLSLENLLDDKDGSDRFKLFLENHGANKDSKMMVEFWYACKGLLLIDDIPGTIEAMWAKYIRNNIIKISEATRDAIRLDRDKENYHKSIFDKAKQEVESIMNKTIYPNFLKSEYCMAEIFGKENVSYNTELQGCDNVVTSQLATVHEDSEYRSAYYKPSVRPKCNSRLTSKNILASQLYRDTSGILLQRSSNFEQEHHHAGYVSGHAISLQDSEIQSLSSGTRTNRSSSYKSGDGLHSSQRQLRKDNQYMKHYAQLNKENQCNITSLIIGHVPRTMRNETRSGPSPTTNPKEFSKILHEKLEIAKQEIETKEKVQQTLCKLSHSEDNVDEARRQHAENSLPPSLLRNKLQEKRILEDNDPNLSDQSILDNHIKNWDPTSGSPKQYVPSREVKMRHFPHLNLPHFYSPNVPCHPKSMNKGRHHSSSSAPHSSAGTPMASHPVQFHPSRNYNNHGRRRERGNDIYSNFSSDSGNVADYHDGSELFHPKNFPKSRSMTDYMENQPGTSDGGSSSRCRQASWGRRPPRQPQADLTDSGVSDSGRSAAPSTSSAKRVTSWLINCSESSDKDTSRYRGGNSLKSTSHSIDALSSSSQKSPCLSSAATAITSTTTISHLGQEIMNMELSRDSPLGQSQTHLVYERRKNKGNGSSSSSKSTGDGGSNGSTLAKSKSSKAPSPAVTTIMYHFPDETLPYVVKLRSSLVTFKMFKEHLPKKGNFRYFFKTIDQDVDCLVNLEVTDDDDEIPLYKGIVVSHLHPMNENLPLCA